MGLNVIYDLTATTLVFRRADDRSGWRTGLALNERLGGLLPPGGHHHTGHDPDESPGETLADAAIRETAEELGCAVMLLPPPSPPVPDGYPHTVSPAPWWVIDMAAAPDRHTPVKHRHLDHTFVGIHAGDVQEPETAVGWLTHQEVQDRSDLSDDSRMLLLAVFPLLDELTADLHTSSPHRPWYTPGALRPVLDDLTRERAAQDLLWGRQEFPDGTGDPDATAAANRAKQRVADGWNAGNLTWRAILEEEFWEAIAESDPAKLRTELLQRAEVAIKWVQALDRRHGRSGHHVKTRGNRSEHLSRDNAAAPGQTTRTATPGERRSLLMIGAYAALGQATANNDPSALIDLAELLRALAPFCGLEADDVERRRAETARDRAGYALGTVGGEVIW